MKICILGDATSIHVQRIAAGLARRGSVVRVLSHKRCDIAGVQVETFRVPRFGLRYPGRWRRRWSMYLRRIMSEHDIVHVHFLHDWGITSEIAGAGRLVVSPWGSDIVPPPDVQAYAEPEARMRRRLLRMARAVTVWGPALASATAAFAGLDPSDIDCVPLGVDPQRFHPRPRDADRPPTVGFLKGFRAVYGPEVLMRSIPRVLARMPSARFELVGDGPLLGSCRDLARSLHVENAITWYDRQPHETVPDLIARWDLSAMPSVCESFGLAALESLAMEVPVVASRVGGLPETVRDGQSGLLVPVGDSDALAGAIVALLTDGPRCRAMGATGRRMVIRQYDWESCLDRWEVVYRRVRREERAVRSTAWSSSRRRTPGLTPVAAGSPDRPDAEEDHQADNGKYGGSSKPRSPGPPGTIQARQHQQQVPGDSKQHPPQ
ncbi:MAG: glycosyltransferase family 4 protein [Phycisphaerales bacterium]|nr:MAG: glycosyltransferase family 4 protein [Phycisphaerales bacterium]